MRFSIQTAGDLSRDANQVNPAQVPSDEYFHLCSLTVTGGSLTTEAANGTGNEAVFGVGILAKTAYFWNDRLRCI